MFRTRDFFISSAAFFVLVIVLLSLALGKDAPEQGEVTPENITAPSPHTTYSVSRGVTEDFNMRRAMFIEKIRNSLPDVVLSRNIETQPEKEVSKVTIEPQMPKQPEIIAPKSTSTQPELGTSTPLSDIEQTPSTSASSSTSTEGSLISG